MVKLLTVTVGGLFFLIFSIDQNPRFIPEGRKYVILAERQGITGFLRIGVIVGAQNLFKVDYAGSD